jgi:hypothetical protein
VVIAYPRYGLLKAFPTHLCDVRELCAVVRMVEEKGDAVEQKAVYSCLRDKESRFQNVVVYTRYAG